MSSNNNMYTNSFVNMNGDDDATGTDDTSRGVVVVDTTTDDFDIEAAASTNGTTVRNNNSNNNNNTTSTSTASATVTIANNSTTGTTGTGTTSARSPSMGRQSSSIWQYLTNTVVNPQQLKSTICMHCHTEIAYQKKIERVKHHLLYKCPNFIRSMLSLNSQDRPDWYVQSTEQHTRKNYPPHSNSSIKKPSKRMKTEATGIDMFFPARRGRDGPDTDTIDVDVDDRNEEEENDEEENDEEDTANIVTVIHCWSAPRSRSTALLYSFEARDPYFRNTTTATTASVAAVAAGDDDAAYYNTIALDEPLYATWLLHESQQHQQQYSNNGTTTTNTTTTITRPYLPYILRAAADLKQEQQEQQQKQLLADGVGTPAAAAAAQHRKRRAKQDMLGEEELNPITLLEWKEQLVPLREKIRTAVTQLLGREYKKQSSNLRNHPNRDCRQSKVIFCKHMAKFWNVYHPERDEEPEIHWTPPPAAAAATASSSSSSSSSSSRLATTVNNHTDHDHPNDPPTTRTIRLRHCHVFLLRDPTDVVTSWNAIGTNVYGNMTTTATAASDANSTGSGNAINEIGMVPLLQIYSALQQQQPNNSSTTKKNNYHSGGVFVLDAEELIQNPKMTLQRLCHHCRIPYTNAMMKWKSGPHHCDGPWAQYWYHDVHQSTGWLTTTTITTKSVIDIDHDSNNGRNDASNDRDTAIVKKKRYRTFNPTYMTALRASYPAYTFLFRLTERHQQRTTLNKQQLYPDDARNEHVFVYIGTSPGYGQCIPRDMAGVSPFDSVVQGGDATWEGIRVYRGKILCFEKHLNRLMKSSKALGFNMQYIHSKEQITDAVFQVLAINNMRDGAHMRLTLTRGEKCTSSMNPNFNVYGTTLIILPEWKPVHGATTYDNTAGISLITASQRRNPPSCVDSKIHHNNLINNILPKIQANIAGVADAIMLDIDGYVSETNATNLFMVNEHGTLLTPHADHCLPGITRGAILELAQEQRIQTEVRRISLAEFHSAEEVFTTGTMGELTPVVNIDGRVIGNGTCGPITKRLQQIYQTLPDRYGWSTPIPPFE